LIYIFFKGFLLSDTFTLHITYRSALNASGILFSLLTTDQISIFAIKINETITIIHSNQQINLHSNLFAPNDGL